MFAKLVAPTFLTDLHLLLATAEVAKLDEPTTRLIFENVFAGFIARIPGAPWMHTQKIWRQFAV